MPVTPIGILQHIGIVLDDLEGTRHLFRDIFCLPEAKYGEGPDGPAYAFRAGDTVFRVVTPKAPEAALGRSGLHHLTFRVDSIARARERLKQAGISVLSNAPPGPNGRPALWADPAHTIGILLQFVEQGETLDFAPVSVEGVVERLDHLGVVCRDNQVARRVYVEELGFPLECMEIDSEAVIPVEIFATDKYGVVWHTRPPQVVGSGIDTIFVTVGDFDLEIMHPFGAVKLGAALGTIPGTTLQDQGTMARFLERRGEGLLHICFKTPDIQRALDTMAARGMMLIDPKGRPGARAGSIGFLDHRSTLRILFQFVQRTHR